LPERSFETPVLSYVEGPVLSNVEGPVLSYVEGAAEKRGLLRTDGIGIAFKGLIRSS
jgi:hypothetical protein